jgi:hypothetical protein
MHTSKTREASGDLGSACECDPRTHTSKINAQQVLARAHAIQLTLQIRVLQGAVKERQRRCAARTGRSVRRAWTRRSRQRGQRRHRRRTQGCQAQPASRREHRLCTFAGLRSTATHKHDPCPCPCPCPCPHTWKRDYDNVEMEAFAHCGDTLFTAGASRVFAFD